MAEILSIPAEFDTIQVAQRRSKSGSDVRHVEKRDVPRPPLGPFTHHAVQTFAKQCSEGRIGLNWRDHLVCARKTWKRLRPEELFTLRQAADRDERRYNERVELEGRGGAEEMEHLLEYKEAEVDDADDSEDELNLDTDPQPPEESPPPGKRKRLSPKTRSPHPEGDDKQPSQIANAEVDPVNADALQWRPTGDENLTEDEKKLLESIPPDVPRWDRSPRQARNAYTLYYADRLTAEGSPHVGEDPHCPSTRAKIHAAWESADHETRQSFKNLAEIDKQEFDRECEEYNVWRKTWSGLEKRLLLRKVIDRWHPYSSFDDGQNRFRADIPRRGRQPAVDYGLPSWHYPVIRTDYSNGAVYEHLRDVLLKSTLDGDALIMELTFYDGLQPPSPSTPVVELGELPALTEEDPRADDYHWCKSNLENKSLDDLKTSFGELSFDRKEHIPVYTFGGHFYAIIVDSQSMKDGTVVLVSMNSIDVIDTRPDGDRGPDGAWEQDPKKEWYLAPRVQAADVVIQLVNLDVGNMDWCDFLQHGVDNGLDLLSDPKAQRWRGWQWAIEYVFGKKALENVVGVVETMTSDAYFPYDDEE